jgi:predicted protein tyrosine phosphatase
MFFARVLIQPRILASVFDPVIEVHPSLFVGTDGGCFFHTKQEWAVIHACKSPCHQRILSYRGNLSPSHPNYLTYERGRHLFLNMIDPPTPLFKPELFIKSLAFISQHIPARKVLVHCNNGLSRAPSIALLFLAKRVKKINNESFSQAASDFKKLYPCYQPGIGIATYLSQNWQVFDSANGANSQQK